jgi:thiamine-phosphate diphosphorylase
MTTPSPTATTTPTADSPIVTRARALAAEAHASQRRRHGAPYLNHPLAVAAIAGDLAFAVDLEFGDDDVAVALLHDVIEDSSAHDEAVVADRCSAPIAARVAMLTKTGSGPAATAAYFERLLDAPPTTRLIKVADRLHNLSELHKAPDPRRALATLEETERWVRPLCATFSPTVAAGLHAALDDGLRNARRNHAPSDVASTSPTPTWGLYAIVQPQGDVERMGARVDAILKGGAARLQLRIKPADGLADGACLDLVCHLADRCAVYGVELVVNDRADLAFGARCRGRRVGVHVGDADLPPSIARRLLGDDALVGTSTHTQAQLQAMDVEGSACHLALGPVWASPTKQGHADVVGIDALTRGRASVKRPVVAIGGIGTPARAALVARAGADFAAVVSALDHDDDDAVHLATRRLSLAFSASRAARLATEPSI